MTEPVPAGCLIEATVQIVTAQLGGPAIAPGDLPSFIRTVYDAVAAIGAPAAPADAPLEPAVSIRASVKPDYLVCLEDGKKLKMLKRHLQTAYNMTPEQYRERWELPADYPMVAPNYAQQRRELAYRIGLGHMRRPS